ALPPPYNFPASFDKNRAIELAALIDAAYQQLTDFQNHRLWTVPGPHSVVPKTYQVTPADVTTTKVISDRSSILRGRNVGPTYSVSKTCCAIRFCCYKRK